MGGLALAQWGQPSRPVMLAQLWGRGSAAEGQALQPPPAVWLFLQQTLHQN